MSKILFVIMTMVGFLATATETKPLKTKEYDLNLYLPGLQFRFEDGADQTRSLKNGYGFNLRYEISKTYLFGIEYNVSSEKSGNTSLSIVRDFTEVNLSAGYLIYKTDVANYSSVQFYGQAFLGQNKSTIKTKLV